MKDEAETNQKNFFFFDFVSPTKYSLRSMMEKKERREKEKFTFFSHFHFIPCAWIFIFVFIHKDDIPNEILNVSFVNWFFFDETDGHTKKRIQCHHHIFMVNINCYFRPKKKIVTRQLYKNGKHLAIKIADSSFVTQYGLNHGSIQKLWNLILCNIVAYEICWKIQLCEKKTTTTKITMNLPVEFCLLHFFLVILYGSNTIDSWKEWRTMNRWFFKMINSRSFSLFLTRDNDSRTRSFRLSFWYCCYCYTTIYEYIPQSQFNILKTYQNKDKTS